MRGPGRREYPRPLGVVVSVRLYYGWCVDPRGCGSGVGIEDGTLKEVDVASVPGWDGKGSSRRGDRPPFP